MVVFRSYNRENYGDVCNFLIKLNESGKQYINWNWARFEWMYEHPEFDKVSMNSIGLWWDGQNVVGASIYDMYFGEAFCGVLPEYMDIYNQVLEYAYTNLKDESGLGIAIEDEDMEKIQIAKKLGFSKGDQTEQMMVIPLNQKREYDLASNLKIKEFIPEKNPYAFSWLLWQGFDHGENRHEFEKENMLGGEIIPQIRIHLKPELSLAVVDDKNENVAYCCLWYDERTDYAYVEPVCTIPSYRGKGVAKAVIYEALNRAMEMGAKEAYVISDMDFYKRLGFMTDRHYTFYWKE